MRSSILWSHRITPILSSALLSGCYTLAQGVEQVRLISRRVPLSEVLAENKEKPERIEKLKMVPETLAYAETKLGLTPGSSYRHYIRLDRSAVSYVVQAAEKRALKLKTWWFPIVGAQPYLGYFDREKAVAFQKEMVAEGYDTSMGGVQAFSLLGYFPDPLYSSMVDNNSIYDFVELLFHETLHRTIYVPNAYTFNENLADFVARNATVAFMRERIGNEAEVQQYLAKEERNYEVRRLFREFLKTARSELEAFYAQADVQALPLDAFIERRKAKFSELHARFLQKESEKGKGPGWATFFHPDHFNNATLLGASVYESRQEPFEQLLVKTGSDLAKFISVIRGCLADAKKSEAEIWDSVAQCKG